jgi:hypothetical protein
MNVRWADIGAASAAGRYCVDGRMILVRPGDIADWLRNPAAVFRAIPVKLFDGSVEHRLEAQREPELPAAALPPRRRAATKARRVFVTR